MLCVCGTKYQYVTVSAAGAFTEDSFSRALKSLLVIRDILFLALLVRRKGLIFSSNSNIWFPSISYSWNVSRGCSRVAIISMVCLNCEKFKLD